MKLDHLLSQALIGYHEIDNVNKIITRKWAFNAAELDKVNSNIPVGRNSYSFSVSHEENQLSSSDAKLIAKIFSLEKELNHFILTMAVLKLDTH